MGSSWGREGEGEAKAKAKARPRRGEGEGQAKARRRQGEGKVKWGGRNRWRLGNFRPAVIRGRPGCCREDSKSN